MCAELPPERLLVFDIESDPPERLCELIGAPPALARHYRVENPSLNRWGEALAACLPFAVKRALPGRLKRPVKRWLGARGVTPGPWPARAKLPSRAAASRNLGQSRGGSESMDSGAGDRRSGLGKFFCSTAQMYLFQPGSRDGAHALPAQACTGGSKMSPSGIQTSALI